MARQRDVDGCSFSVPLILPVLHRPALNRPSFPSSGIIRNASTGPAENVPTTINNDNSSSYSAVGAATVVPISTAAAFIAVAGCSFAFYEGSVVRCC